MAMSFKLQEIKITLWLTLPLLTSFLAQKGIQLIDTFMMGWIGPEALAAGALGTGIFITIINLCRGILSAAGVFIVRARGAEQTAAINCNLQQSLYLAWMLALPCMVLVWVAPYTLTLMGQDPVVVAKTQALMHALVWGLPGYLLFLTYREFIAALLLTRVIMMVTLCSIPLNFIANYVLIYGKLGFPALNIAGIGYASASIMWFMFFWLWLYSKLHPHLKPHTLGKLTAIVWPIMADLLKIGVPSGIIYVLDSMMFLMAAILVGYFGVVALAAFQITMQWITIAFNVPLALSVITSLQVGHALGAADFNKARRLAWLGLILGLLASIITVIPFFLIPELLVRVFLQPGDIHYQQSLNTATAFLVAAALFQCCDAIQVVVNGILRGYKDTLWPMLYSIACYLVMGIGGGYYLAFHTAAGAMGIWYGLIVAISSAAVLLLWRFWQRLKLDKCIQGNL